MVDNLIKAFFTKVLRFPALYARKHEIWISGLCTVCKYGPIVVKNFFFFSSLGHSLFMAILPTTPVRI
jgi:hypothetical protein